MKLLSEVKLNQLSRSEIKEHFRECVTAANCGEHMAQLVDLLLHTSNHHVRDCLAMRLSQVSQGDVRIFDAMIALLQDTRTLAHRGTLLFCLRSFDCSNVFPMLVDFVVSGGFEVAHEAHGRIVEIAALDNVEEEFLKIKAAYGEKQSEPWRMALLKDLMMHFVDPLDEGT